MLQQFNPFCFGLKRLLTWLSIASIRTLTLVSTTKSVAAARSDQPNIYLGTFKEGQRTPRYVYNDAILFVDGSSAITGRKAIEKSWEGALKMDLKDHTFARLHPFTRHNKANL
jgi:hypothetical protein